MIQRPDIAQRQVQRERAAGAGRALQGDFAAQQSRKLATDGKPGRCRRYACGWCHPPAGRLENEFLLRGIDTDARVVDLEAHRFRGSEDWMLARPAADGRRHTERTPHAR
jgi:hypothetical protein